MRYVRADLFIDHLSENHDENDELNKNMKSIKIIGIQIYNYGSNMKNLNTKKKIAFERKEKKTIHSLWTKKVKKK